MKHSLLFWGMLFGFLGPLMGQKLEIINPLISTDSVRFAASDNKDGYWRVQLWVQNKGNENIFIEKAIEKEHPYRELFAGSSIPIRAGEKRKIYVSVPIDYDSEGKEREITLFDDYEEEVASFRLQTLVPRPTFSKSPNGWTSIRENQIYPLRVNFGNPTDQVMILDSLVWDSAATDSSLRFKRWAISPTLPEKIVPGGKAAIKIRIWTKGLFATISGKFILHYHFPDSTQGQLPFAHAFGVEPNIWVKEGGQWDIGTIAYGQKISRRFWLTHEGAACITLVPEFESFISLQDTIVCPGDTTYGVVQYPTICDSIGDLDIEIALFVKEFSGHVPFRFRGQMEGEQMPPGLWLAVQDSVHDLGRVQQRDRRVDHSIELFNQGPVPLEIESFGFSQYVGLFTYIGNDLDASLSEKIIPAGGSIQANLTIEFPYLISSELIRYFNVAVKTEGCPAYSAKQSVRLRLDIKP
ncbi:MAG: hypothetical protein AAF927_31045 [Bacteroidota bacterium]